MSFPKPTDTPGYVCSKDALGHRWWSTPRSKNHLASETDEDMFLDNLWVSWKKMKYNLRYRYIIHHSIFSIYKILYLNEASFSAEFPLWKPMSGVYLPLNGRHSEWILSSTFIYCYMPKAKKRLNKSNHRIRLLIDFLMPCILWYWRWCPGYITSHGIKRTVPVWMILISGNHQF